MTSCCELLTSLDDVDLLGGGDWLNLFASDVETDFTTAILTAGEQCIAAASDVPVVRNNSVKHRLRSVIYDRIRQRGQCLDDDDVVRIRPALSRVRKVSHRQHLNTTLEQLRKCSHCTHFL